MDNNSQNQPSRDWPSAPSGSNQPPRPRPPVFPQPPKPPAPPSVFSQPKPATPSYPMPPSMTKPVVPPGMPAPRLPMPVPSSLSGPSIPPAPPAQPRPVMPPPTPPTPKPPVAPASIMARQLPPMPPLNLPASPSLGGPQEQKEIPRPASAALSRVSISELSPKKPLTKILTTALIGLVIVGGIGSLTYFVILPTFFGAKTGTPAPVVSITHDSFFVNPAAASAEIKIPTLSALDITTALQNEAFKQLADQQVKEISVSDKKGQVNFSKFLTALAPALSAINIGSAMEGDFTGFMYYDSNGVWPGYVGKLRANVDVNVVKQAMTQLSSATNLDGLYLASPGVFQSFKDGQYKNYATRYSAGSKTGASLNYAFIGDYFIISTSFSGFKAALPLLGL